MPSVVAGFFLGGGLSPLAQNLGGVGPPKIFTPKIHCKKGQKIFFRAAVQQGTLSEFGDLEIDFGDPNSENFVGVKECSLNFRRS